jgi:predicted nucleotidyltransferase
LEPIVRQIVAVAAPERIILFGSAARGEMQPDSDLDLLVIKGGNYNYHRLISDLYAALAAIERRVEIVLATPEQTERYRNSFCLVIHAALTEGKLIYERAAVGA